MFRILLTIFITVFALPAMADDGVVLSGPSETAMISADPANVVVFYRMDGEVMEVTLVFEGSDGETFRTRIGLDEDQVYKIVLGDEDGSAAKPIEVSVHRHGTTATIVAADHDAVPLIAAN